MRLIRTQFLVALLLSIFLTDSVHAGVAKSAPQDNVRIALVPFKIEGEKSYAQFMGKFKKYLEQAVQQDAELVVFPELLIADMVEAAEKKSPLTEQMQKVAKEITPQFIADIKKLAAEHKVAIVAGSSPYYVKKELRNTAFMVFPDGRLETQDKIYLTPDEKDWKWSGGNALRVFNTPYGRLVVLTCYDAEFPQISHDLAPLEPELIIVPSMTDTVEGFRRVRWTAQARAIEHRAYVLHVGTVGNPDPSWPHWGQASALSPSEKNFPGVLKEGKINSDELLVLNLDMKKLREARAKRGIHPAKDQNERKLKIKMSVN